MVDPPVPQSCLEYLAESDDFLMHGVVRRRFATHNLAFFEPVNAVFIDLACGYLAKHHIPEKRNQMVSWDSSPACSNQCSSARRPPDHPMIECRGRWLGS